MGTPCPHVSRHVSGRAPRRDRRPQRPVFRSPIAGCTRVLHVCLRRPYFFQQRKKYGKERRQRPMVFGFPSVRLRLRCKKVPQGIASASLPAAAPAYRAKTFFSRAVQRKCFTSYILLYSAARRAAPIYHSPPENATRSRVPRLNAPMGTLRPHVSRHVSGRAPRRGRRPRRPASAHHRIPVYSRLILRRGRRPRRPVSAHPRIPAYSRLSLRRGRRPRRPVFRSPIAGCTRVLHVCLRWPYFFQQRKKYGKERRQKPTVFGFPLSESNHGTKRFRIESLVPPSPLPLPRTTRRRAGLSALRRRVDMPFYKIRFAAARIFYISRPNGPLLHLLTPTASARFDNRLKR